MTRDAGRPRPLVAGNWKMNGQRHAIAEGKAVWDALAGRPAPLAADV